MKIDSVLLDALAAAWEERARRASEENSKVEDSDGGRRNHYQEEGRAEGTQNAANELRSFIRILGG